MILFVTNGHLSRGLSQLYDNRMHSATPRAELLTVPRNEVPNESLFPTQLSRLKSHTTLTLHAAGMV